MALSNCSARPPGAALARTLSSQRTQRVHGLASSDLGEDLLYRGVDSVRKGLVVPVPPQWSRVSFGDHLVADLVVEHELELRELLVQMPPPPVEDISVQVVFRPHRL
jgi:hypothetical protein